MRHDTLTGILVSATLAASIIGFAPGAAAQCGDCDGDSFVTILDALRAVRIDAGLASDSVEQRASCDVHLSPGITVLDGLVIAQAQVGLLSISGCRPGCRIDAPVGGTQSGDVSIDHVALHGDRLAASITAEFSTDSGASFQAATMGAGGDGTSGLSTSPAGDPHTFVWASAADVPGTMIPVLFRITLTNPDGSSNCTTGFSVTNASLSVAAVIPDRGPADGGEHIQIQGTGFTSGQAVTVDGVTATDVQVLTSSLITCKVPRAAAGRAGLSVDIAVDTATLIGGYSYFADAYGPTLFSVSPMSYSDPIATTTRITFHFDAEIDPATVQDSTGGSGTSTLIAEIPCGRVGSADVSEDGHWITVRSGAGSWHANGGCTGQIRVFLIGDAAGGCSSIADFQGNVINSSSGTIFSCKSDQFNSVAAPTFFVDAVSPTVVSTSPTAGASGVRRGMPITVTFSERMDWTTVRQSAGGAVSSPTLQIFDIGAGIAVPGSFQFLDDGTQLVWTPDDELRSGVVHEIRILDGGAGARAEDLRGNGLAAATISFTSAIGSGLQVVAADPPRGDTRGGYPVRVIGDYFGPGAMVTIGGVPCTAVRRQSRSELVAMVPPGTAGARDVTVINQGGGSAIGSAIFTYVESMPVDLFKPELLFEFPEAASGGGTNLAATSSFALVFSEPMSISAEASTVGSGQSLEVFDSTNAGTVTRSSADPRILIVDPAATLTFGSPGLFLIPRSSADPARGMRDMAGNRLHPRHSDRRYGGLGGGSSGIGLSWTRVAVDAAAPLIVSRAPASGSNGNHSSATIRIALDEPFDPLSIEAGFTVVDGSGPLTGALSYEVATLEAFTFTPSRDLVGTVIVDPRTITDLSGNAVGGSTYTFDVGTDVTAPVITDLTLDGIPDHINGDAADGGGSPGGGRLRMPPSGFSIDLSYSDGGGRVSLAQGDFEITSSTSVGGLAAGVNLATLFPAGHFTADDSSASFLVPSSLMFPAGTTAAGAMASTITVRVRDRAGNLSAPASFTFDCVEALLEYAALDVEPDVWHFLFGRDDSSTTYNYAGWETNPAQNCCACGDGDTDFEEDLLGFGLGSDATFSPNGTAQVASGGGLTMNAAARNWVINRLVFHAYRHYGLSVSWADGNLNPGFAGTIDFVPDQSLESAAIRFRYAATSPGASANRLGYGGYVSGVNGRAAFDSQNRLRNHDNGETCGATPASNRGVFPQTSLSIEHDTTASGASSTFRQVFDRVTPFSGGGSGITAPTPIGNSPHDALVLDPTTNPDALSAAARARYEDVMIALDGFAMSMSSTVAHEVGHSLGAVQNTAVGAGLYGNLPAAFPGSTAAHIELDVYVPGRGENIMGPSSGIDESISRYQVFNELLFAYFLNRSLVVY